MKYINRMAAVAISAGLSAALASTAVLKTANADEKEELTIAFPDKWMIRAGAYVVDQSKTQVSLNSNIGGIGTVVDYQRDLGGEDGDTIPRIDAYYRFNPRHRIDFTAFSISRKGERTLAIDIDIGDENFLIDETVRSDIKYTLYKFGYSYSFYHSPKTELSLSAGLNVTDYDLKFENDDGTKAEAAGVTVPLPVIGLRLGYAITPRWYVRYISEAFFIDIDNTFRGGLINLELNTEYKIFNNFALGVGLARLGTNVDVDSDDWRGSFSDGYRGVTVFGTLYF